MKKKIVSRMLFALLLLSASISVFSIQPAQAQEELPAVYFEPALSSALSGEHFTVDIMVKDVERLYAWQIYMTFNPNVLQFVNVTEGDFLSASAPEGTWTVEPVVDNTAGTALFGWAIGGAYIGPSGSGWLATIEFSVTDYGASVLFIDNNLTKLMEYRLPPPPPGETVIRLIPHTRENGFFSTDVAELLRSYAELSASYSSLLADYTALLADYAELSASYSSLLADYTALLADYAALSTSYSSQTSIYQSLLTEYEDLQSKFEDSESDYATLRANFDSLNSTYVALKADFDSLDSTYTSLQSEQNDMQSRYDTLSGDFAFATNLNYVLAIAIAILVVTTLLLLRKKRS